MKYVIVDDNETDRMTIAALAMAHKGLQLVGDFEHPLDAAAFMRNSPPDLLFLDVEMPLMNGPEFLRSLSNPPLCIFVTSHPDYAVEAFELFAIDYILKPIRQDRFDAAIARAEAYDAIRQKAIQYEHLVEHDSMVIHEGYDSFKISISDITYLEALKDYTRIYTTSRSYIVLGSLGTIMENINQQRIRRIHRSFAVNTGKVTGISEHNLLLGSINLPVGKTFRKEVLQLKQEHF